MEILSKLFESEAKVKIMRLFLFNQETVFDISTICEKSKVDLKMARKQLLNLQKSGMIKRKSFVKTTEKKVRGKIVENKKKLEGYILNENFHYLSALRQLLISTKSLKGDEIVKRLSKAGKLKLVVVAGVFIEDKDSRVDMFVVGNNLSKSALTNAIKTIEAELGKELVYVHFETPDYEYRLGMYDKLIRDVMDYPHKVLLDKINTGIEGSL